MLTHGTKAGAEAQTCLCPPIPQAFPTSEAEKIGREERPNEDGLGHNRRRSGKRREEKTTGERTAPKTRLPRRSPSLKTPLTEKHSNVF